MDCSSNTILLLEVHVCWPGSRAPAWFLQVCFHEGCIRDELFPSLSCLALIGLVFLCWLPISERVKEAVEEFFGCEFELFVEFTGLIRSVLSTICKFWHLFVSHWNSSAVKDEGIWIIIWLNILKNKFLMTIVWCICVICNHNTHFGYFNTHRSPGVNPRIVFHCYSFSDFRTEWIGLIMLHLITGKWGCSWGRGANIGWHSDDNRDYLRQRHFAVCFSS